MNYLLTALFVLFSSLAWGQSAPESSKEKAIGASKIKTAMAEGELSASAQTLIWLRKTESQPANPDAWLNYFLWNTRTSTGWEKTPSMEILLRAQEHIGGSPQFFLMQYLASGKRDTAALSAAFTAAGDKRWLYPYMIQYSILSKNKRDLHAYCISLDSVEKMQKNLYQYHYNVLMSADSNATIYAHGLNDLVPMAVLQEVYGIRTDIRLRYYETYVSPSGPTYLALSLGKTVLAKYPSASCTGLLVRLDAKNSFEELKWHWEKNIQINEAENLDQWPEGDASLYRNYLPSMVLMYRYYKHADALKAARIKTLIGQIAEATGLEEDKILESK